MIRTLRYVLALVWVSCLPYTNTRFGATPASLIEAGHYKRARTVVEARLREYPDDAYALYLGSKIKQSFGDLPGAIVLAERAVVLEPRSADCHSQLAEVYAYTADQSSWLRGLRYVRLMKREVAAALAIEPRHTDTLLVSMMFYLSAPRLAGGDKPRAQAIAGEILINDPRWGYLAQARLLENSGDDARLERLLQKAVSVDPSHYRALFELARFYCCVAVQKHLAAAERISRQAIQIDPRRVGAYDILARIYASERRWVELESTLSESEQSVPDDLAPFYQAAKILIRDGSDGSRAAAYLRKYLSQEPEGREPTRSQAQSLLNSAARSFTEAR